GNILLVGGSSVLDAELFVFNSPPIASCQDMTVSAGPNCTADASINNGSFDPDGDPITLIQNPPGPYPLGSTEVTLTVADNNGATDQCTATVTVV
ncbi:MAG: HYR domain-containing protein, partial [Aliifodinibius sp.]|nr:HYR domain-containing protein [Fodinibius sp.]NIV14492.1 HYR domain-containing protein [Fodinibius sp.]NIY28327.1 HYR domain-containing protein [Fodinibius sp.]